MRRGCDLSGATANWPQHDSTKEKNEKQLHFLLNVENIFIYRTQCPDKKRCGRLGSSRCRLVRSVTYRWSIPCILIQIIPIKGTEFSAGLDSSDPCARRTRIQRGIRIASVCVGYPAAHTPSGCCLFM